VLASVIFDLPTLLVAVQPGLLGFADTSSIASLTEITGYRIGRHELRDQTENWVSDDFSFGPASVPAPFSLGLSIFALLALGGRHLRNAIRRRKDSLGSSVRD
jgi:hypothetical protein